MAGWWRHLVSWACRVLVHVLVPSSRRLADPLGGLFAVRRSVLEGVTLRPCGYKNPPRGGRTVPAAFCRQRRLRFRPPPGGKVQGRRSRGTPVPAPSQVSRFRRPCRRDGTGPGRPRSGGAGPGGTMSTTDRTAPVRTGRGRFIVLVTTIIALMAAALFGVSTALQHRSAGLVSDACQPAERLGGFLARTFRHPLWVIGAIADIGGFALHALALHLGPLTVVQPLLVTSIVFAVVLRQLLVRRWPRRSELAWATSLTLGLVLFLTIATPASGVAQPADPVPATVVGVLIGFGVLGLFAVGRRYTGSAAAALLGTAAGLSYAAVAGLLKEDVGLLNRGVGVLASFMAPLCSHCRRRFQHRGNPARLPSRAAKLEPANDHDGRRPCQLGDWSVRVRRRVPQRSGRPVGRVSRARSHVGGRRGIVQVGPCACRRTQGTRSHGGPPCTPAGFHALGDPRIRRRWRPES